MAVATAALITGMALVLLSGAGRPDPSVAQTLAQPLASPTSAPEVPGPRTNAKIEAIRAELARVSEYEAAFGCLKFDRFGRPELCGDSKTRVDALHEQLVNEVLAFEQRDAHELAAVRDRIRDLTADPSREIAFSGTSANPYTNNGKRIEQYRDAEGFDFWVDPTTNGVVQFGPGPNSAARFALEGDRTIDQLRAVAETYFSQHVADFSALKQTFAYRENAKPGGVSYSFRYESRTKPAGEDVMPFVQIVLSPAGEVMSFADIRSLYEVN